MSDQIFTDLAELSQKLEYVERLFEAQAYDRIVRRIREMGFAIPKEHYLTTLYDLALLITKRERGSAPVPDFGYLLELTNFCYRHLKEFQKFLTITRTQMESLDTSRFPLDERTRQKRISWLKKQEKLLHDYGTRDAKDQRFSLQGKLGFSIIAYDAGFPYLEQLSFSGTIDRSILGTGSAGPPHQSFQLSYLSCSEEQIRRGRFRGTFSKLVRLIYFLMKIVEPDTQISFSLTHFFQSSSSSSLSPSDQKEEQTPESPDQKQSPLWQKGAVPNLLALELVEPNSSSTKAICFEIADVPIRV